MASSESFSSFLRRLRHPRRLIDWDETALYVFYCITKPSRVAELACHRYKMRGSLARCDPGILLVIIYLTIISALMYGLALDYEKNNNTIYQNPIIYYIQKCLLFIIAHFAGPTLAAIINLFVWPTTLYILLQQFSIHSASLTSQQLTFANQFTKSITPTVTLYNKVQQPQQHNNNNTLLPSCLTWMYCFDVVCNAAIPAIAILAVLQYLCLPIILLQSSYPYLSTITANLIQSLAASTAVYSTAVGILILPSPLCNAATTLFIPLSIFIFLLLILTLFKFNVTIFWLNLLYSYSVPDAL